MSGIINFKLRCLRSLSGSDWKWVALVPVYLVLVTVVLQWDTGWCTVTNQEVDLVPGENDSTTVWPPPPEPKILWVLLISSVSFALPAPPPCLPWQLLGTHFASMIYSFINLSVSTIISVPIFRVRKPKFRWIYLSKVMQLFNDTQPEFGPKENIYSFLYS